MVREEEEEEETGSEEDSGDPSKGLEHSVTTAEQSKQTSKTDRCMMEGSEKYDRG